MHLGTVLPKIPPKILPKILPKLLIGSLLPVLVALDAAAADILSARFGAPTQRYDHGILGDAVEWGSLILKVRACQDCGRPETLTIRLPRDHVFEDLKPRLADLDGDGDNEIIVVESDLRRGAALAIYDDTGKLAQTPHIGRTHRWLAPLGAADLDGDGQVELAYIDRPHLARTLRIWRYSNGALTHVTEQPGLTNHRIGQDFISGGIRTCAGPPEIITANADWTRIMASTLSHDRITTRDIGAFNGPGSLTAALNCP